MTCDRCHGLMVEEVIEDGPAIRSVAWRCVNCSNIVDAQTEQNRLAQQAHKTSAGVA